MSFLSAFTQTEKTASVAGLTLSRSDMTKKAYSIPVVGSFEGDAFIECLPECFVRLSSVKVSYLSSCGVIAVQWAGRPSSPLSSMRVGSLTSIPDEGVATFLTFPGLRATPVIVLKVAKEKRFNGAISQEYRNLVRASQLVAESGFASVPKPLGLLAVDECKILVESFLEGKPFAGDIRENGGWLHRRRTSTELDLVARWISVFGSPSPSGAALSWAYVDDLVKRFTQRFVATAYEETYLKRLVEAVGDASLSLAPTHGDFAACNLLRGDGKIGVLDWTFFKEAAPPLTDLAVFVQSRPAPGTAPWFPNPDERAREENSPGTWYRALLDRSVRKISTAWQMAPCLLPVLWGVSLLYLATMDWSAAGQRDHISEAFRVALGKLVDSRRALT